MRAKGLTKAEVRAKLLAANEIDLHYRDGKILSSMCTGPHPSAKWARQLFAESNLGDPGLFKGSAKLEKEVIASLSSLLHGPSGAMGYIVSGGTEANLLALYAARNEAKTRAPEVVISESAHFSFDKICDLLCVKLVKARLDAEYRVDTEDVENKVNENTIAVVGNAGSAELGTVDPIGDLAKIAVDRNVPLHVDAAFGGFVLPFLKELGYFIEPFDFGVAGVRSITADPHKMGFAPVPAGGILFRDAQATQSIRTDTPYLTEPSQFTFVGTRPGAAAAAVWAVFESMGHEGFRTVVKRCMDVTKFLCEGLKDLGFGPLVPPTLNMLGFKGSDSQRLVARLRQRGWYVSYVPRLDCVRVVIMPHTSKGHVRAFLSVLREIEGGKKL